MGNIYNQHTTRLDAHARPLPHVRSRTISKSPKNGMCTHERAWTTTKAPQKRHWRCGRPWGDRTPPPGHPRAARSRPGASRGSKWRQSRRAGPGTHDGHMHATRDARARTPNDAPVRCRRARRTSPVPPRPPAPSAAAAAACWRLAAPPTAANRRLGALRSRAGSARRRRCAGYHTCARDPSGCG